MATSGRPCEVTFTPDAAGTLLVTVNFIGSASGSDWGGNQLAKVFCEQSGTTTYGGTSKLGTAKNTYTLFSEFAVTAGSAVKCGLFGQVTGASAVTFEDVYVRAELIKR